jgi:hypothetical protein
MLINYNYSLPTPNNNITNLQLSSCDPPFCSQIMKQRAAFNNKLQNYKFGSLPKLDPNIISNTYRSNNEGRINAAGFLWRRPKIQTYNLPKSSL